MTMTFDHRNGISSRLSQSPCLCQRSRGFRETRTLCQNPSDPHRANVHVVSCGRLRRPRRIAQHLLGRRYTTSVSLALLACSPVTGSARYDVRSSHETHFYLNRASSASGPLCIMGHCNPTGSNGLPARHSSIHRMSTRLTLCSSSAAVSKMLEDVLDIVVYSVRTSVFLTLGRLTLARI